ncbi:MAG TPA: DUF2304 domain-containing protein [Bacilli bacterium]|nr:DUF2304 domain-containing protein [Bacilli bacterium]
MNYVLQVFLLACGLLFFSVTIYLLLKKKISEWNSITWFLGSVVILIVSANPNMVDSLSERLGVSYPPALVFLLSSLVLLVLVLYQSMQISDLQKKLRSLAQHVTLQAPANGDAPEWVGVLEAAAAKEDTSEEDLVEKVGDPELAQEKPE